MSQRRKHWRDMADTERGIAYSPSASLPDGDLTPFLETYAKLSAETYAAHSDVQTLTYGKRPSNTVDLFRPSGNAALPLHIFIHGGYWRALSKRESTFPAQGFLDQGIAYAAVDYTLAPHASLDEIVAECLAAVTMMFEQAQQLGVDPNRISLSGSSAGAHLAAMTCLGLAPQHRPCAAILLSGVFELEPLVGTYINDPVKMSIEGAHRNSPALKDVSNFPKALLAYGEIEPDEFKRQTHDFAAKLPEAQALEVSGRNHFDVVHDLSNESALAQHIAKLCVAD
ncbi:alpha/beta hydrolase [Planktotalea sp.]|uniref:alpha/beta hydrolase n=1 Tax=Planktotalea sp. TaxID=2029877 RepID=UPI003D6BEE17